MLVGMGEEVEHFPWGVVNNLTKASPHMLQRVGVALWLSNLHWGIPSDDHEAYFRQIRSALPNLDKLVIMSVSSQAVRSSSQVFAGLILMINSSRI